jgi:hypothetical protein
MDAYQKRGTPNLTEFKTVVSGPGAVQVRFSDEPLSRPISMQPQMLQSPPQSQRRSIA